MWQLNPNNGPFVKKARPPGGSRLFGAIIRAFMREEDGHKTGDVIFVSIRLSADGQPPPLYAPLPVYEPAT